MDLSAWLKEFRTLHEEANRGALGGCQLSAYRGARNELARALLAAQRLAIDPGREPRSVLPASRVLQAQITFFDGTVRAATRSFSSGGFAALLAQAPKTKEEVAVVLRLPGGEPFQARARVVEVKAKAGSAAHVSFAWVGLSDAELERIELLVFDTVLEHLQA